MKKEDYLESDDIEIATLYANIICRGKGVDYLIKVLKNQDKYILDLATYYDNNKVELYTKYNGLYHQIKSGNFEKLINYDKKNIIEAINKIFNNL